MGIAQCDSELRKETEENKKQQRNFYISTYTLLSLSCGIKFTLIKQLQRPSHHGWTPFRWRPRLLFWLCGLLVMLLGLSFVQEFHFSENYVRFAIIVNNSCVVYTAGSWTS